MAATPPLSAPVLNPPHFLPISSEEEWQIFGARALCSRLLPPSLLFKSWSQARHLCPPSPPALTPWSNHLGALTCSPWSRRRQAPGPPCSEGWQRPERCCLALWPDWRWAGRCSPGWQERSAQSTPVGGGEESTPLQFVAGPTTTPKPTGEQKAQHGTKPPPPPLEFCVHANLPPLQGAKGWCTCPLFILTTTL